jgi:predicted RNA binding protein YcfA (HicA-like mRNA interferase family)
MDLGQNAGILKKIKFGSLEPALQGEIIELADSIGYETTITAESDLGFLLRIYNAERAKEKRSAAMLKKAEELIMRLSSLHFQAHAHEMERKRKEKKTAAVQWKGGEITVSARAKELLESVGISDERVMERIVEFLGEKGVEGRVEAIHATNLGDGLVKKLFAHHPELLLKGNEREFISQMEMMEVKKEIVDNRYREIGQTEQIYIRYPEILLEDFHEISRIMSIEPPPEARMPAALAEQKKGKTIVARMDPDDFIKVLRRMGFELKTNGPHRVLSHPDGKMAVVQSGHGRASEFGPGLIRMKLREIGIRVEEFERVRKEVGV